ncbi:hypothetical protein [Parageobacillus thermantarcticus]|uniref:hypothetical protein n=1 Tax=Parageobacillus thermantarcticus TaxID=186116 RepID=UPI001428BEBD|nr:hypothetical protein [Parageobacillus thermantarcticus]
MNFYRKWIGTYGLERLCSPSERAKRLFDAIAGAVIAPIASGWNSIFLLNFRRWHIV